MRTFTYRHRRDPRLSSDIPHQSIGKNPDYEALCLLPAMVRRGINLYDWYSKHLNAPPAGEQALLKA